MFSGDVVGTTCRLGRARRWCTKQGLLHQVVLHQGVLHIKFNYPTKLQVRMTHKFVFRYVNNFGMPETDFFWHLDKE